MNGPASMLHSKPFACAPEAWKPNRASRANVCDGGSETIVVSGSGGSAGTVEVVVPVGAAPGAGGGD